MKGAVKGFAVAAVAFLLCISLADAANRDNSWEIGAYIPHVLFDDPEGLEIDDSPGFGIRGGYNITKNHEIEFSYSLVGTEIDDNSGTVDADYSWWQLGYIYNFHPSDTLVPFIMGGFGSANVEIDDLDVDEDETLYFVGGGLRWFFNETFGLRFEGGYQTVDVDEGDFDNMWVGVGATFVLGG